MKNFTYEQPNNGTVRLLMRMAKQLLNEPSMKLSPTEIFPDHAPAPEAGGARSRTLFIHVPKSGGTTLDCMFRDHFYDTPLYPTLDSNQFGLHLSQINDPANWYVGGHYPVNTVDINRFDCKITTLRDPLDVICSSISFANKISNLPAESPSQTELQGKRMAIYEKYYTPYFDTERYCIDLGYGIAQGLQHYVGNCDIQEVLEHTRKFNYVFDFRRLDDEIKYFLIQNHYFPYYSIYKKRAYRYQPDYERAKHLLTDFDQRFYQIASSQFRPIPDDIETRYQQYRDYYCKTRGLALQIHQSKNLDLRGPIGSGWFNVEKSERGTAFRWSEDRHATIEIPVAQAGLYAVYLYLTPSDIDGFKLRIRTTQNERSFPITQISDNGVQLYKAFVFTRSHDWIHVDIDIDKQKPGGSVPGHGDVRSLGVALGHAYIVRHPL